MQNTPQRETIVYKNRAFRGLAHQQYERDLKKRTKDGWHLVSCTESGRDLSRYPLLTAIYEKPGASLLPSSIIEHLSLLLPRLSEEERILFYADVQSVINQWLARKVKQ